MSSSTQNTDFEVRSLDAMCVNESTLAASKYRAIKYFVTGLIFGFLLLKAEVVSWWRIQEMFRLASFHLYGVIGSAVFTAMLSVQLLRYFQIKTIRKEAITLHPKKFHYGQILGAFIFGLGWGLVGACPGPMLVQMGRGVGAFGVIFISAVAGTWVYGYVREKLWH